MEMFDILMLYFVGVAMGAFFGWKLNSKYWIDVEYKLPENSKQVLVKAKTTGKYPTVFYSQASYHKDGNGYRWSDWCGDTDRDKEWVVLSWMELPK